MMTTFGIIMLACGVVFLVMMYLEFVARMP